MANHIHKNLVEKGWAAEIIEQPLLKQINNNTPLLIITSTTGNGELPARLQPLHDALQHPSANTIELRYALLALGDSTYPNFCGGGRMLAKALDRSGATAMASSLELDACFCINPEDQALPWVLNFLEDDR